MVSLLPRFVSSLIRSPEPQAPPLRPLSRAIWLRATMSRVLYSLSASLRVRQADPRPPRCTSCPAAALPQLLGAPLVQLLCYIIAMPLPTAAPRTPTYPHTFHTYAIRSPAFFVVCTPTGIHSSLSLYLSLSISIYLYLSLSIISLSHVHLVIGIFVIPVHVCDDTG